MLHTKCRGNRPAGSGEEGSTLFAIPFATLSNIILLQSHFLRIYRRMITANFSVFEFTEILLAHKDGKNYFCKISKKVHSNCIKWKIQRLEGKH